MTDRVWIWVGRIFKAAIAVIAGLFLLGVMVAVFGPKPPPQKPVAQSAAPEPAAQPTEAQNKTTTELCAPYPKFHGHLRAFNKALQIGAGLGCVVYGATVAKTGDVIENGIGPDSKEKQAAVALLKRSYPGIPEKCADGLIDFGFYRYQDLIGDDTEDMKEGRQRCIAIGTAIVARMQENAAEREVKRQLEEK